MTILKIFIMWSSGLIALITVSCSIPPAQTVKTSTPLPTVYIPLPTQTIPQTALPFTVTSRPRLIPTPTPTSTSTPGPTDVRQLRLVEGVDVSTQPLIAGIYGTDSDFWGPVDIPNIWGEFDAPPWNINIMGQNFPCYVGLSAEEQDESNIIEVTVGGVDIKPAPTAWKSHMWNICIDRGERISRFNINLEIPALDFGKHEIAVSAGGKVVTGIIVNRTAPAIPENFKVYDLKDAIVVSPNAPSVDHVTLGISPVKPKAGREMEIMLRGLSYSPRTKVDMETACISLVGPDGKSLTTSSTGKVLGGQISPDEFRIASWITSGVGMQSGEWSLYIDLYDYWLTDGTSRGTATPGYQGSVLLQFQSEDLELVGTESIKIGIPLTRYHREESSVFFSDDVPSAVAFDSIRKLELAAVQIEETLGEAIESIPHLYLVKDIQSGNQLRQAVSGRDWQTEKSPIDIGGFYTNGGAHRGIFIKIPAAKSELYRYLVHEYIHHVNYQLSRSNSKLPVWMNEGIAEYYGYQMNYSGKDELEIKRALFRSLERAYRAALSGELLALDSMEDEWGSEISHLHYSESHMVVRFMIETFGPSSPFDTVREFGKGDSTIEDALLSTTGLTYKQFESEFREWIGDWSGNALELDIDGLEKRITETRHCYPRTAFYRKE